MTISKIELKNCLLNLGEIHRLHDFEHFNPVFTCVDESGNEFTAPMRLHISEPLESLVFADPRHFANDGYAENSVGSKIIKRKKSFDDEINSDAKENILQSDDVNFFEITKEQISEAISKNYDFEQSKNNQQQNKKVTNAIAFTCHDPNIIGGGNIILFRLVNWLSKLGVRVSVYSCGSLPSWMQVEATFHFFETYKEMFEAISEDVVVLYTMWHIEGMLETKPKDKLIYHIRQIYEPFHYGSDYESMVSKKPVIELLERLPIGVIAISPHLKDYYKKYNGLESKLITNGLNPKAFYPTEKKKFNTTKIKLLSVGDPDHFVKGSNTLFEALTILSKQNQQVQYEWVIASGSKRNLNYDSIPKNLSIQHLSGLNQSQMRSEYNKADIFVNPSLYEGFGLPSLEAMLCGTPVVQADNLGLDYIIENKKDCLVVPINDSEALAEALDEISKNQKLAEELIISGLEKALKYTTYHQFKMFTEVFGEILNFQFDEEKTKILEDELISENFEKKYESLDDIYNTSENPLISVILPSYNQAEYLKEALDSIIAQTYTNWEAIVINDGSKDNTEEIMHEYAKKDKRIKAFSKPNGGITSALNAGLEKAKGDFFCWLSSDDLFYPEKLELQIKEFNNLDDSFALVYGSFDILNHEANTVDAQPFQQSLVPGCEFPEAFKFDFIDGCTIMIRMNVMREVEGFNPSIVHSQDMELWVRLASYGYKFKIIPHKLTIRRVHEAQSSTSNMIHCRYDAAWMMNFYIENYHLTEMYRYINFESEVGIKNFVYHFVGRMVETESNINHPLLQEKFWNWFSEGIKVFSISKQNVLLRNVLIELINSRSRTPKIEYYINRCLQDLKSSRATVKKAYNLSTIGRNFRIELRSEDKFAKELFEYGLNLLINTYTPLFAQELYFHNTNKVVDTPYKLAHSVFRYLSQFENLYKEIVLPYSELSFIPENELEAINLFCDLQLPIEAGFLKEHLQLMINNEYDYDRISSVEDEISEMSDESKERLRSICQNSPTSIILFYWNALTLIKENKTEEALDEGWNIFELENRFLSWAMTFKLGVIAEKTGDYEKSYYAFILAEKLNPNSSMVKEYLEKISAKYSNKNRVIPNPSSFIYKESKINLPNVRIVNCKTIPQLNGKFIINTVCLDENGREFKSNGQLDYAETFESIQLYNVNNGKKYLLTTEDLFEFFVNKYNFTKSTEFYLTNNILSNKKQNVAFSIPSASSQSGGAMIAYRFADWLSKLGVEVSIYSEDKAPTWFNLNVRFKTIGETNTRYKSILEDTIIAFSVLELPDLLKHQSNQKRIFHLAQVVEDFHYHGFDFASVMRPKGIFEILHSLPVGRISISKHIERYIKNKYQQETYLIENGIDSSIFKQRRKREILNNEITITTIGNPDRMLKGVNDVYDAVNLLAKKRPNLQLKLNVITGNKPQSNKLVNKNNKNFNLQLLWGLSQDEVKNILHQTDIYVNGSWYEGFGLPSLEAMSCGVPVIQADNRGLDTIISNKKNCVVYSPSNVKELSNSIEFVIDDNELRKNIIKGGIGTVSNYTLSTQFNQFVKVFEQILIGKFNKNVVESVKYEIINGQEKDKLSVATKQLYPKFSVIIPVVESSHNMKETLDSLLSQIYENWEAVIVYNFVNEVTNEIIRNYCSNDLRIQKIECEGAILSQMLNLGLNAIDGDWIISLPAGTIYAPDRFMNLVNSIEQVPDKKILYSEYYVRSKNNLEPSLIDKDWPLKIPNKNYQILGLANSNYIIPQAMIIHKSVYNEIGYYDERFNYAAEYFHLLKMHTKFESKFIRCGGCAGELPNSPDWKSDKNLINEFSDALDNFLNEYSIENLFPIADITNPNVVSEIYRFTNIITSNKKSLISIIGFNTKLTKLVEVWFAKKNEQIDCLDRKDLNERVSTLQNSFLEIGKSFSKELQFSKRNTSKTSSGYSHPEEKNLVKENSSQQSTLLSIVVLSYNNKKYLEECLNSIVKHTKQPFEIIIVDNASDDETIQYLNDFRKKIKNTLVIFNPSNLGFPVGINQGLLQARGEYIVIANNDIVVTDGWINRMIAVSEVDQNIGIVGPISNSVSGVQLDKNAIYKSIREMHEYAKSISQKNKEQIEKFPRVAFLCTLIRKEVLKKIGGLDERFTPGNFEDDDFCLRAQLAGYKTVIAKDVFIHHYGSVSFKQNGTNEYAERLKINERKFIDKWGNNPEGIWLKEEKIKPRKLNFPINKDVFNQSISRAFINIDDEEYELALGNLNLAIENYETSERIGYENIEMEELLNIAGTIALSKNDLEVAKEYFEEELKNNPDSSSACFGLGEVFNKAEMYQESKTMFEWAINNDSQNKNATIRLEEMNSKLNLPNDHNSLLLENVEAE